MVFRSRRFAKIGVLLSLLLFALLPWTYMAYADGGGFLLLPLVALSALSIGLVSGCSLPRSGLLAASVAAASTALVEWSVIFADTAFDNLFAGKLSWWKENLAAGLLFLGCPAVLVAGATGLFVSKLSPGAGRLPSTETIAAKADLSEVG